MGLDDIISPSPLYRIMHTRVSILRRFTKVGSPETIGGHGQSPKDHVGWQGAGKYEGQRDVGLETNYMASPQIQSLGGPWVLAVDTLWQGSLLRSKDRRASKEPAWRQ